MEYYNVHAILVEEEKIKVSFPCEMESISHFIRHPRMPLPPETPVEVPYYLASFLLQNDRCTRIDFPVNLLRDDLMADAYIVDLHNTHFFALNGLMGDREFLAEIFFSRISVYANFIVNDSHVKEEGIMSVCEKRWFNKAKSTYDEFKRFYLKE